MNESNDRKPSFQASGLTFEEATLASFGLDPSAANRTTDDIAAMQKDKKDGNKENS
jgi:hypothetical protein